MAPEIALANEKGEIVTLSSFKGKYVLVDFWASWCGPCRGENPNVVTAYEKYKHKNFTVLGVSLDDNKENWLEAIKADKLNWQHISDCSGSCSTICLQNIAIDNNCIFTKLGNIYDATE